MTATLEDDAATRQRSEVLFAEDRHRLFARTDRMFLALMIAQWIFAVVIAVWVSPYAWAGRERSVHAHVYAAVFLGGLLSSLPVALAWFRPGATVNRYVIAVAQAL